MKKSSFVYVFPEPDGVSDYNGIAPANWEIMRDTPQVVILALQAAAVCGWALE
jgi:hypothetical protein